MKEIVKYPSTSGVRNCRSSLLTKLHFILHRLRYCGTTGAVIKLTQTSLFIDLTRPSRLHEAHGSARGGRAEDDGKGEGGKTTGKSFFENGGPIYGGQDGEISNLENRPFHWAYLVKKLPCPLVAGQGLLSLLLYALLDLERWFRSTQVHVLQIRR